MRQQWFCVQCPVGGAQGVIIEAREGVPVQLPVQGRRWVEEKVGGNSAEPVFGSAVKGASGVAGREVGAPALLGAWGL